MLRRILPSVLLLFVLYSPVFTFQDDPERQRAFTLFKDWKLTEALPLFEKVAARYPNDAEVFETWGMAMVWQSPLIEDAAARKAARKRGRELLVKAQSLGASSALLRSMLESIAPDGGNDERYSSKKEVDDTMREGEAAFTRNDMPKAIEMYQRALALDPNLYEAALYTGDVYYKTAEQKKAGEWFARAIAINPDRETAYRYWGDSLMKQGRLTEASEKFVEAYIAEPYNRLARAGLIAWANKAHVDLAHPEIVIPTNVTQTKPGNVSIVVDENAIKGDDGSASAWTLYGFVRATWADKEFKKSYPAEKDYRHSLKEEAAALRGAIEAISNKKPKDPTKIDKSLQTLMKLEKEGLLEAYVLLALPDDGIVQDFRAYRRTNAENLRRYVKDYVLTGGAGPKN